MITVLNLIYLFTPKMEIEKNANRGIADFFIILFGGYFFFFVLVSFPSAATSLYVNRGFPSFHAPVAHEYFVPITLLYVVFAIGFFLLRMMRHKLSPVITVFCLAGLCIGFLLMIVFLMQLSKNFELLLQFQLGIIELYPEYLACLFLWLHPLNIIICIIRLARTAIAEAMERLKADPAPTHKNALVRICGKLLLHSGGWMLLGIFAMLPVLLWALGFVTIFGQTPDAVVRAFTQTCDWTFSQLEPPPPLEYSGHYLCTVALRGNAELVKPTRLGIRHGTRIVVNRQLCVANAIEEVMEEKTPWLHSFIRKIYDRRGFSLAQHIVTQRQANLVYLMMKPLEWIFVLILYTVDRNPENRIARQYTQT